MSIKNIVKVIKGLFKGEIPGYVKHSIADEVIQARLDKLENEIWNELSHTDLRFVAKAMLNRLYFNTNAINLVDMTDDMREVQIIRINERRDKLIADIKKLEAA